MVTLAYKGRTAVRSGPIPVIVRVFDISSLGMVCMVSSSVIVSPAAHRKSWDEMWAGVVFGLAKFSCLNKIHTKFPKSV